MIENSQPFMPLPNLQVEKKLPDIIAITSGKGSIGKTFLSINLAFFMRQYHSKVLLLDTDPRPGNIAQLLNLHSHRNLAEAINENLDLQKFLLKAPGDFAVLSSYLTSQQKPVQDDQLLKKLHFAFSRYEREYNTIIVDAGAGNSRDVIAHTLGANKIIIIVTSDPDSITEAYSLIKIITGIDPTRSLILIPNMMSSKDEGRLLYDKLQLMVVKFLNVELIFGGTISRHQRITECMRERPASLLNNLDPELIAEMQIVAHHIMHLPIKPTKNSPGYFNRVIANQKTIPWD
jgi:flagellar biosynthesis protein FlhG